MTDTATKLIVETPTPGKSLLYTRRAYRASRPVTISEVWDKFAKPGRPKPIVTLSGDTVRVTF